MSDDLLPEAFRHRPGWPVFLPRWPKGRIRLVDIAPETPGPLVAGGRVVVLSRDGFFESVDGTVWQSAWCAQLRTARCRLEETLDDQGRRRLVVSDPGFQAAMPRDVPSPLIMAAYHAGFVRRMLGGLCEAPSLWLCLYRNARLLRPGSTAFDLANLATDVRLKEIETFFSSEELSRLRAVQVLASDLLHRCRPNMMVALSAARVSPPERSGLFAEVAEYDDMDGGPVHDFD